MNVVLWILQCALALLSIAGGAYKVLMFTELAKMPQTGGLPHGAWAALGIFEVLCGIALIIPRLTPPAAAALAVESIALAVFYARYSLQVAATNPLVWVVAIAFMAAFVAYRRYRLRAVD